MRYRCHYYEFKCECGLKATRLRNIGITSLGELQVEWYCQQCRTNVCTRLRMEKLICDVPEHPSQENLPLRPPLKPSLYTEQDMDLLAEMHVTLE